MMKLTIDDRPVETPETDQGTISSLLDSLRERGDIGRQQVVVSLRVNRRPWKAEDLEALQDADLGGVEELAIGTAEMEGYARRILTDARGMLQVLLQATGSVAQQFRTGRAEDANARLFELLNALQQFLNCLYSVKNSCQIACGGLDGPGGAVDSMVDSLDQVQVNQENQDWAALASHLEDSFLPTLRRLDPLVGEMIDAI